MFGSSRPTGLDFSSFEVQGQVYGKFIFEIGKQWFLGPSLQLFDIAFRETYYTLYNKYYVNNRFSSGVAFRYYFKKFNFDVDYGLVSLMYEAPSFAFSTSKAGTEQSVHDYSQNENPFDLSNYFFYGFWEHLQLQTSVSWHFSKRFSAEYHWKYYSQHIVKNYPSTFGYHSVGISYKIINR